MGNAKTQIQSDSNGCTVPLYKSIIYFSAVDGYGSPFPSLKKKKVIATFLTILTFFLRIA